MTYMHNDSTITGGRRPPGRPKDMAHLHRRREDILECATKLFASRGFRNTDLKSVADQLGVAKGTIYNYFDTKNDLFFACLAYGMQRMRASIDQETADATSTFQLLERGMHAYFAFFDANPDLVELLVQERAEFKTRETSTYFQHVEQRKARWVDLYETLRRDGIFRDIPGEKIFEFVNHQVYGALFANYFSGRKQSLQELTAPILDIFYRGVLSEKEQIQGT
ncbi:MAG: TetR/AcrR family transcriptional regulator [Candidatus Obscuribacter phosphatis]|jgi:AcrR family transcriptional regulator|uniref:TetR/AcrR family transcriptional regulator n=1 Tax=Candidatus Obscuribacter phosphatis TaxID=1906157 RepID=A0A8J7TNB5_9BACT|nr:TetR/AcrR family transcriptional regulator [Candidatus Obscuribacter phosphatis]